MVSSFEDIWQSLAQRNRDGGYVQRAIYTEAPIDLYLGLDVNETRFFIFAARKKAILDQRSPASSSGIEIQKLERADYGEAKIVHRLRLTDAGYTDFFDKFVLDVCIIASAADGESSAYAALINRISQWQRFFARHALAGLSEEQQRGLFGELHFLRELMNETLLETTGIFCWRGPSGADQDFQFPKLAVEVKVSLAAQNQEIIVSSERQLDGEAYSNLFIYHLALSKKKDNGETLAGLVTALRHGIPPGFREEFERGLFEAGYLDEHFDLYTQDGYTIREKNYFEVKGDFPRITETELQQKPGVGKVRYSISVPACKRFLVEKDEFFVVLRGTYRG